MPQPSRLQKLLLTAAILATFAMVWTWAIVPQIFPQQACVYESSTGEVMKAWGKDCNGIPGAIVLTVK